MTGGDGSDALIGGRGRDTESGGGGADTVSGGSDGDTLNGGAGSDDISGGSGNDDLTGGPGVDDIDGGTGTNWCTVGSSDSQMRCVYDEAVPVSDEGHLSQDGVDVTQDDREVTARVHVTDDTGVTRVDLGAGDDTTGAGATGGDAELVSGNARDGWWEATLVVPRWSQPGTYVLSVGLRDRVGRWGGRTFPGHTLKVTDRNPDVDRPRSRWSAPARTSPTTCGAAGRTSW